MANRNNISDLTQQQKDNLIMASCFFGSFTYNESEITSKVANEIIDYKSIGCNVVILKK
jgi:hypothetical protein